MMAIHEKFNHEPAYFSCPHGNEVGLATCPSRLLEESTVRDIEAALGETL